MKSFILDAEKSSPAVGKSGRWAMLLGLLAALSAGAVAFAQSAKPVAKTISQGVILDNVTIVNTRDGALSRNMSIVIDGGKITQIEKRGSFAAAGGASVIDGHGKFVVPGYLDMHAHPLNEADPKFSLPLMVANGITGFRQMSGTPALLAQRREGKLPFPAIAPELLATPGMVLAGPISADPQAVVAEVRKQAADGADFIKVVDLSPPAFYAALSASRELGLPFVGHLPPSIDVREAAKQGMKAIEHLGPHVSILEACSTDEAAVRQGYSQGPTRGGPAAFNLPPAALMRATVNPILMNNDAGFRGFQHVLDTYDDAKCRALAKDLVKSGMWQSPTLIRLRAMAFGDDAAFRNDPNLRYVSSQDRALWASVGQDFTAKISPEGRETLRQMFALQLKLIKLFDDAGVKMLAGTDVGGQWIVPGFSLHQEFDLLQQAGVPPLHVLQMATLNGAQFLGREARMGTVDVGKDANLVILDANPIASVRNLHRISGVVRGGVYYSRSDLDGIIRGAIQP